MAVVAVVVAVVVVVEAVPHSEQMLELEQRVGLAAQVCFPVLQLQAFHYFDFAGLLVDDAASTLAFAFASRDFDE
jgi:phosphopantetheine adenylyltransferase